MRSTYRRSTTWRNTDNNLAERAWDLRGSANRPFEHAELAARASATKLLQVRRAVAEIAAALARIDAQATQLQKRIDQLQAEAIGHLEHADDTAARRALTCRSTLAWHLDQVQALREQIQAQHDRLARSVGGLECQVTATRARSATLAAAHSRAWARVQIAESRAGLFFDDPTVTVRPRRTKAQEDRRS